MKKLILKFAKQYDDEKELQQQTIINKLKQRLPKQLKRIGYADLELEIKTSSQTSYEVVGYNSTEKKTLVAKLEDIFNDDTLLAD